MDEKKRDSCVVRFIELIYDDAWAASGQSWVRLNGSLHSALMAAITAGMRFELDDFDTIYRRFKGGYWFYEDNGEQFYAAAVQTRNRSACHSFEKWKDRKPFITKTEHSERDRAYVGCRLWWDNRWVKVTSFGKGGRYLTACTYRDKEREEAMCVKDKFGKIRHAYLEQKIDKRYTLTREGLKAQDPVENRKVLRNIREGFFQNELAESLT